VDVEIEVVEQITDEVVQAFGRRVIHNWLASGGVPEVDRGG
jgi:hypothetical protein